MQLRLSVGVITARSVVCCIGGCAGRPVERSRSTCRREREKTGDALCTTMAVNAACVMLLYARLCARGLGYAHNACVIRNTQGKDFVEISAT